MTRSCYLAAIARVVAVIVFTAIPAVAPLARAGVEAEVEIDRIPFVQRDLWEYIGPLAVSSGMITQEFFNAFLAGIDEEPAYNFVASGWLDHDGDVVAATLTTPDDEQHPFRFDTPTDPFDRLRLETLVYGSIGSLSAAFPPGTYSLDITYSDTRIERLQAILLPYDLDSFPDYPPLAILRTFPLTISWGTVAASSEYEISALGVPGPLDYHSDNIYLAHPATREHEIPGNFAREGVYWVQVVAEQDVGLGGSFRFELNSQSFIALDNRDGDGIPHYPGGPPCVTGQAIDCDDNCPYVPNVEQADTDGNGLGDACQCGDVNGDGLTNVVDALKIARGEVLSGDPNRPRCDVNGDGLCNVTDALRIARGEVGSAPEDQLCPAYLGSL
jgi:hypothetical protein